LSERNSEGTEANLYNSIVLQIGMMAQFSTLLRRFNKPAIVKPRKRPPPQPYNAKKIKQRSLGSSRSVRKHV
jgi:hypothetical protein